jgi:hypothetical protein
VALNGTAVASPGASDGDSGIATAVCGTPDTSTLGAHAVSCTATDKAGNTASASASYLVSAVATKQALLNTLNGMLATPGIAREDAKRINKAIEEINKSLDARYWETATTLDPKDGDKVFDREAKAAGELAKIVKDGSLLAGAVQAVIDSMVAIDRALAAEAIALAAGGDQHDLDKALKQLQDGDREWAKGFDHADNAIRMYREAWKHAQKALKKA